MSRKLRNYLISMGVLILMILLAEKILPTDWVAPAYVVLALIVTITGVRFTFLSVWEANKERYDQHMKDIREIVNEELKKDKPA